MADLTQIFDSLKDLAEKDGTVAAERLHHVLTKIGMQLGSMGADAGARVPHHGTPMAENQGCNRHSLPMMSWMVLRFLLAATVVNSGWRD